jgi:hypothetical protein
MSVRALAAVVLIVAIAPSDEQRWRQHLHERLRRGGDLHDAYFGAPQIGNEETVPLLLERLRVEYGAAEQDERNAPPGTEFGYVCTHVHLVDGLRAITNTDRGMYYPRWAEWWESNRKLARRRWILNGFAEIGLHAIDPIDERFRQELMEVLESGRKYHRINARRLLGLKPAVD